LGSLRVGKADLYGGEVDMRWKNLDSISRFGHRETPNEPAFRVGTMLPEIQRSLGRIKRSNDSFAVRVRSALGLLSVLKGHTLSTC
jgi:hypothetical protein